MLSCKSTKINKHMYIRIVAMVKNEIELIEDWLKHHGPIAAWWGIHVFDNGSTDGTYEKLLEFKQSHGINVHQHNLFLKKGEVISQFITKYNKQPGVTMPLDADEFVVRWVDDQIEQDPENIREYLLSLTDTSEMFRTRGHLNSIAEQEAYDDPVGQITKFNWSITDRQNCKKFFNNKGFISTDLGFHTGVTINGEVVDTDVVYLHYHDVGRESTLRKCEQILTQYNMDLESLRGQRVANGEILPDRKKRFPGVARMEEYLNYNNWEYDSVDVFDVKHQFK